MIIYPVAVLYFAAHFLMFYMAWNKAEAFEAFNVRIDKSIDDWHPAWLFLMCLLVMTSIWGFVYSWFQR